MNQITDLNMIKSIFAALGAKTTDSNYAVPVVNKTTAEPKGYMDMASLASVLGVERGSVNMSTQGQEQDINYGNGILLVIDRSSGGHKLVSVSNGFVVEISSKYDSHFTVTKKNASTITITRTDSASGIIKWLFLLIK